MMNFFSHSPKNDETEHTHLPKHVGIIMDGNRRWAKKQGLSVLYGHDYVSSSVIEPLVDRCLELGIKYLTLWAFSTENWKRDQQEVQGLMQIFRKGLQKNGEKLHQKGVRLCVIGDIEKFPEDIQKGVRDLEEKTKENHNIVVSFALNYGGRDEILRAVNKCLPQKSSLTAEVISSHLDTAGFPDPDLIIRPGGEKRLSGFLTWQAVYAELYFTDVLMPEFTPSELDKALADYEQRQRRFGA